MQINDQTKIIYLFLFFLFRNGAKASGFPFLFYHLFYLLHILEILTFQSDIILFVINTKFRSINNFSCHRSMDRFYTLKLINVFNYVYIIHLQKLSNKISLTPFQIETPTLPATQYTLHGIHFTNTWKGGTPLLQFNQNISRIRYLIVSGYLYPCRY